MFSRRWNARVIGAAVGGGGSCCARRRFLPIWLTLSAAAALMPVQTFAQSPPSDEMRTRVGPLEVSAEGRRQVRGGRDAEASIHVAWVPPAARPDRADREALEAFERAAFPRVATSALLRGAPEPWMEALTLPDVPIRWNKRTAQYLRFFKDDPKGAAMMRAWMRRAGRYEDRMRAILREVGVPEDLVMVALAESGFNPRVRSEVGAAGPWQFMEATGHVYGLRTEYWVDDRYDVEKSTYAAALYLKDLHVRFGSWELALAAYNAGYGLVLTTIQRHNTNNFWDLCEIESGLPYATTNYVPKIMAAAIVSRNRATFKVDASVTPPLPAADWVEVAVKQSTALSVVAAAIGAEPDLLAEFNAHLVRGRTPPRPATYRIRIPRDKLEAFRAASSRLRQAWAKEATYEVRHGESLDAIASAHGIDERQLRRMNGIRDAAEVVGGTVLVVPHGAAERRPKAPAAATVLAAIPPQTAPEGRRQLFFVTTRATTPTTLEQAFGVPWSDIVRWNDLDPYARLQTDQVLAVWVSEEFDPERARVRAYEPSEVVVVERGSREHLEAALERRGLLRRGYRVRRGDTLQRIGRRFDLTVGSLARINALSSSYEPRTGDVLVVYVPPAKRSGTIEAPPPKTTPRAP